MVVEIIAKIQVDLPITGITENSDSVGDYKLELDCNIGNEAIDYLSDNLDADIEILSASPIYEGADEYINLLNNWKSNN
jgi:hypothetical protein